VTPENVRPPGQPAPRIGQLRIRNLTKQYAETTALRAFDLDVHGGEFISLLGPSGCGKTTALNCVAGLVEPDGGSIELDGRDLAAVPPERRGFGMVFQSYALFPHLTAARNVAFGLEIMGGRRQEITRRVADQMQNLVNQVLVVLAMAADPIARLGVSVVPAFAIHAVNAVQLDVALFILPGDCLDHAAASTCVECSNRGRANDNSPSVVLEEQ